MSQAWRLQPIVSTTRETDTRGFKSEASLVDTVSKQSLKKEVVGHDSLCRVPLAFGRQRQKGRVLGEHGLHSEFQASEHYRVRLHPTKGSCSLSMWEFSLLPLPAPAGVGKQNCFTNPWKG